MNPREFASQYGISSLVACFSGGKDSLVSTHYTFSQLANMEPQFEKYVVFVDTTVMVPIVEPFVREVCNRFGWPLKILRPETDFWTLAEKWGCPSMKRRWCCYNLKLKPIFEFVKDLPSQRAMITGLRREESKRREKLPEIIYRKKIPAWSYAPIIDWSEKDVLDYIKDTDLPTPPHYRLGIKETCVCGAFGHIKDFMILKALFPELYQKFVELEEKWEPPRTAFYDKGRRISAKALLKQKALQDYIGD